MNPFTRYVVASVFISIPAFLMTGCFPSDEGTSSNPTDPDPIVTNDPINGNDNPADLPKNVNTSANTSDAGIDSMFNLLNSRVKKLDEVSNQKNAYNIDFKSLRDGLGAAVVAHSNNVEANTGFIVSSVLSINSDPNLQKIIDSIDVYVNNMDAYYGEDDQYLEPLNKSKPTLNKKKVLSKKKTISLGFLSKAYSHHGILSAGQALVAETPKVLMSQNARPNFPRFLTLSHIQDAIEAGVIPRLNEVIAATQRLRSISNMSLPITVDGETTEIDVGDITILEGMVRAARAGFTMMLIYNADIYSPDGSNDMRWVDSYIKSMNNAPYIQKEIYSLHGDTLYDVNYYDETNLASYIVDVMQYNFKRSDFLSIRKNYHSNVYNDLKEVPVLFKAGLAAIDNETDNQDDDLIPATGISDMTDEMSEFSREMLDDGFTPSFASNFKSPEALMDFISEVLSGPYEFNETIEGKQVKIKIDISKFFTNPESSLKNYWPKYRLTSGNDRYITSSEDTYVSDWETKTFTTYPDEYSVIVNIPASKIDEIDTSDYSVIYHLANYVDYTLYRDSIKSMTPIQYLDDNGNALNYFDYIDQEITKSDLPKIFPYFNDYTFGGVFPDLSSRQKWIDFFGTFID